MGKVCFSYELLEPKHFSEKENFEKFKNVFYKKDFFQNLQQRKVML